MVAMVFSDPLNDTRIRAYWQIMSAQMTLHEWQDACMGVMQSETFNKMPLPASFLAVVIEARQHLAESEWRLESREPWPELAHTSADYTWARLHVEMVQARIPRLGHLEDAAEACEHYATIDLDNAADWRAEAAWWRNGAHGRPLLPSIVTDVSMYFDAPDFIA